MRGLAPLATGGGGQIAVLGEAALFVRHTRAALAGDFAPGFYVKHIRKDIGIAVASADEMGLSLPGLDCARKLYDLVAEKGWDEFGTQVLYRLYTSL